MSIPTVPLRPPSVVMRLERLGAFHQTRISFVRTLVRRMMREAWQIERTRFDLDDNGYGICVYLLTVPNGEQYSMVIYSQYLADEERTDRVIAEKWDVAAALCEGVVSDERILELQEEVPKQEAGRCRPDVLVLSRANKSTRNFSYFVDCLANGRQPSPDVLAKVGYLLRTTAVYGNGKFGVADYVKVKRRVAFDTSFSAQMFTVFMIRQFSIELVEHLASVVGGDWFVPLDGAIKRYLGVGNATGLGMAPFLIKHPRLIHAWFSARETALARVLAAPATATHLTRLASLTRRAIQHVTEIETIHERQAEQNRLLLTELPLFLVQVNDIAPSNDTWQQLLAWAMARGCYETQELVVSLLLELYPELVDELERCMEADESTRLLPNVSVGELKRLTEERYQWALRTDFAQSQEQFIFWYRSAEKEEPRLGERFNEPGADLEMFIGIGRAVKLLYGDLAGVEVSRPVLTYLFSTPQHRGIIQRILSLADVPYGEIQDNLLGTDCLPIHLLRAKLAMFGASKFDPRSNLWVRITLFQGAPLVSDIGEPFADDWCFPVKPE